MPGTTQAGHLCTRLVITDILMWWSFFSSISLLITMRVSEHHNDQFPAAFLHWKFRNVYKRPKNWLEVILGCKTWAHWIFKLLFESNYDVHKIDHRPDMVWFKSQNGCNENDTCNLMLLYVVILTKNIVIDVNDIMIRFSKANTQKLHW